MSGGRALYISSYAPSVRTGRDVRNYTCVRALSMLGDVDVLYVPHDADEPCAEFLAIENARFHRVAPSRGLRRAGLYIAKRAQGAPPQWSRGVSPELVDAATRLAGEAGRGRIVASDVTAATALLPMSRRMPVIYNAHNIESDYVRDPSSGRRATHRKVAPFERRILASMAESWMVSRRDVQTAERMAPGARLRYVPNVVDVASIVPRDERGAAPAGAGTLMMVGDFTYEPNREARHLLAHHVMPLVWRERPEVTVQIAGRELEPWTAPDPRVRALGFVDDLGALYRAADCVVVPLLDGAGSPLKFVEALAYAVPVAATPVAARGLEVTSDVHYAEGADAAGLAAAILGVLANGGGELARAGRALAESEYSIASLAGKIAA